MKYVSPEDIVAFTDDGVHSMAMEGGVPIELPDHMVPPLVALGARPYVEGAEVTAKKPKTKTVLADAESETASGSEA